MKAAPINLATLAGGAAMERFEHELSRVLENIADVNTEAEAVREIVLRIKFKPTDSREDAPIAIAVLSDAKLTPLKGHASAIYMVRQKKGFSAIDADPRQVGFEYEGQGTAEAAKPTVIRGGKDE